jgi:hypothetical protein
MTRFIGAQDRTELVELSGIDSVLVFSAGKLAITNLSHVAGEGIDHYRAKLGESLGESRPPLVEAEQVVPYEHLAARPRTCADPDGRHLQPLCDERCDFRWNGLENHGKAAGVWQSLGLSEQLRGAGGRTALRAPTAERSLALGGHSDMAHNGHSTFDDCPRPQR